MAAATRRLLWHPPGSRVPFGGRVLPGMVYVAAESGVPCVLDPSLPVSARPPIPRNTSRHPSYATLSPEHRNMLLAWHEEGRMAADVPTGIALMHLFSLERRLLCGNPSAEEAALLRAELRRMMRLMSADPAFSKPAGRLMEEADRRAVLAGEVPIMLLGSYRTSMTAGLRLHLARLAASGQALGFREAMAGWLGLNHEGKRIAGQDAALLVPACEAAWPRTFPQGMVLAPHGVPRLPVHLYEPAMWGLRPHPAEHEAGLPDPQAMDWRVMATFVDGVAPTSSSPRPSRARSEAGEQMAGGAIAWLSSRAEHESMPRVELVSRMLGSGTLPTRRNLSRTAALLHSKGWGMEPDSLWSDALAPKDSPAFVFRLDASTPRSQEATPTWPLAILLWSALDEQTGRLREACDAAGCTLDMRRRLRLCAGWWEAGPKPRRARLRWAGRTLASLGQAEHAFNLLLGLLKGGNSLPSNEGMAALEDACKTMGLGSPWSRIMGLEKPQGRARKPLPADVVMMPRPVLGGGNLSIPSPPAPGQPAPPTRTPEQGGLEAAPKPLLLDPEALLRIGRETEEASRLLSRMWEEEESAAPVMGDVEGLTPALSRLLSTLLAREEWREEDFAAAVAEEGLRLGGAVESLNEWAWERLEGTLLEEGGTGWVLEPSLREATLALLGIGRS